MANYTNITASWETGTLTERMISRQFDDAATLVSFAGIPTGDDVSATYHLIVWMATEEGGEPTEQSPIQLSGPEWLISNFYTQFQQSIQFQLCIQLDGADDYEAHSPIFSGRIGKSLRHDGETSEIDTATMFDPYKEWVQEQAMAAGAVVIDNTLSVNGAAADAKAVGDAIKAGKNFVVQVPGSAAVFSGSITAGDFAKALAAYTAGSGVYAVKDGEVYQLSAAGSSTMTFTQMYHGTMNFIKQIVITSADTFTVTNTALSSSAEDTSYNNTTSGLTATNVQAAIDENAANLSDTNERLREQQANLNDKVDSRAVVYGYNKFLNDASIWENGGISTETGENFSPTSSSGRQRVRSIGYITGVDFIKWLPTSGWTNKINVYAYDENDTFVGAVADKVTQFGEFDYTQYKYRVTLARNTDESIDVALSRAVFLAEESSFATEGDIEEINTKLTEKTVIVKCEKGRFKSSSEDQYYNSLSETKAFMINAYPIIVDGATKVVFPAITLTDTDKFNIYWRDSAGADVSTNILTCAVDNNTINVPSGAYYLDIMICYSGLYDLPIKIVGGNDKTGEQRKRIYTKNSGEQVCYFAVDREKDVYSACCFMLPPNYNATGKKIPIVLWFDGNTDYRTIGSTFKPGKLPGLQYLRDEGFAVIQIYSWGSYFYTKYPKCGDDQPYPSPTCLRVLETGLRWFGDRYNVDLDNIHIVSKSMGGLISLFFVSHPIAPFKSVSMFSPIIDMFGLRGRYSDARKALFEDNALQGDVTDFSDINTDGSTTTGVENYYFSDRCLPIWDANKGAIARLNSAYSNLVGGTLAENISKSVADSRAWYADHDATGIYDHTEYKKISSIPVKIWGAMHDPDVQYKAMVQVVEQLRNSGCDAELKSVNSYDHSRFDVNTTDAQTVTTALGIVHENVPIGWVESMQWIRSHSVKY